MDIIYELAKKYSLRLWGKTKLDILYENNRLTKEEYNDIIGEDK